ncbi:MAG: hypothetical protein HN874_01330 [Euryarchaeota archaeon]|jgi:hypothetical protein|nr:hypothetical protein [Euryarchaeota archaeon]MBT7244073.1 hypothetical protein [Euryarchaeota archaeon]
MDESPLLTMTKSRVIDNQPELSPESLHLLEMLSGLCSFHTSEDLASFLFTEMFRKLVGNGEPWVVFEVGVYLDHTKLVEIIAVHDGITIADSSMSGLIPDNVVIVKNQENCAEILQKWHDNVMNE